VGYAWRVVASDRPDLDNRVEARAQGEDAFEQRYAFEAIPRSLSYFEATCDYLQSPPESPFTGDPVVSLATERGRKQLEPDALARFEGGERTEGPVAPGECHDALQAAFWLTAHSGARAGRRPAASRLAVAVPGGLKGRGALREPGRCKHCSE